MSSDALNEKKQADQELNKPGRCKFLAFTGDSFKYIVTLTETSEADLL